MEVTAKRRGYYDHVRRNVGDVFEIKNDKYTAEDEKAKRIPEGKKVGDVKAFSSVWMEKGDKTDDISSEQVHSFTDQTIPKPSIAETGPNEVTFDPRHSGNAEDKGLLKTTHKKK